MCASTTIQKELERLQNQKIILLLGVDESFESFINFVLFPKPKRKVRLFLDSERLNQMLIMQVYMVAPVNVILSKLAYVK